MRAMLGLSACIQACKREEPKKIWVVWYESQSQHSAGMECFNTIEEALEFNKSNPPETIPEGKFNQSLLIVP